MSQTINIKDIQKLLIPIFAANGIEKAILFGSYAKGTPTDSSDVDILIDSKGKLKGIDFFGVLEDTTQALNKQVDLIEASQLVEGGKIQQEILNTGVLIYERF